MKKILSIFLVVTMLLSMAVMAIPAGAAVVAAPDPAEVGNTVITDANRAAYIEKLREEGYKELDYAQMVAGLETEGKYFLSKDFDLSGKAKEYNLPMQAAEDTTAIIGMGNSKTIGNVIIDGCGYALTVDTPLFMYSANITVKNVTFKGIIDSYKISPDGGAFSVFSLWTHWGYVKAENVTSEVTVTTTNHSIEGRDNGAQKLAALTIDAGDGSYFKNVRMKGDHTAEEVSDHLVSVGAIAGSASGTVTFTDCVSEGNTFIKSKKNLKNTNGFGGMVGYVNGNVTFENCHNNRNIIFADKASLTSAAYVGGLAGNVTGNATFKNCTNSGAVTVNGTVASKDSAVGGLAGIVGGKATVENSANKGAITYGAANSYTKEESTVYRQTCLGGLIGKVSGGADVNNCQNDANVVLNSVAQAQGGLVGYLEKDVVSNFTNCVNNGTLKHGNGAGLGQPERDPGMGIGGIVGLSISKGVNFSECKNTTPIAFTVKHHQGCNGAGGILGYQYLSNAETLSFSNCENTGAITNNGKYNITIGGICGGVRGVLNVAFSGCANSGDVKHASASGGWPYAGGMIGIYGDCGNWMVSNKALPSVFDMYCCVNTGDVVSANAAGGMVGSNNEIDHTYNTMTFFSCHNTGDVSSRNNAGRAGGVIGDAYGRGDIVISNSVNEGAAAGKYAGGIAATAGNSNRTFMNVLINNCKNTGGISGVIGAGGIVANIIASVDIKIENCYNGGAVSANGAASEDPIAGGILGYTGMNKTTLNGCANAGTVNCTVDSSESAVTHSKTNLVADCTNYYLSGCVSGGSVAHGTPKSQSEINSIVNSMKFLRPSNPYLLNASVRIASALFEGDYTAATWSAVANALATAQSVSENFNSTQAQIDNAKVELDKAVAALVIDAIDYAEYDSVVAEVGKLNRNDWSSTTWLDLQNAIKAVEELKLDKMTLQSQVDLAVDEIQLKISKLEERGETDGKIDVDAMGQLQVGGTLRPVQTQPVTDTSATETPTEEATEPVEEGGCGGIIGGAAVVVLAVTTVGMGISLKKKKD